ncbi:hypothetical protein [Sphingobacterium cellulitidis]|uniref:Uncharacterized protein n=1 Tax=Sphingobacterium cellulitidis TaxID=1768011 RepID=A0A8H9G4F9_9SPHI|nr:hypothetical protein [Sphingobacterium soli]MBA8985979.1 hypothetical protein [Sphingobacterium soli]GGE28156.1 hypothetical protein GCM10011516_27260 [Sphingobacterium soli]
MAKKKIQYQDKTRFDVSGDQITGKFTYADANQIKDVVNTNADLLHEHNNKLFLDKINQDLSNLSSPNFKNLGVEGNVNANVVSANTEVNTAIVNATNKVNTKLLNADNAVVNFHINSDTLTAETQIDTNILNALLQVNTDTVNASNVVNTDILNADSQVNTVEVRTNIARVGEQSSEAFVSGFAGLGYRLARDSNGNYMLELDRLTVRKDFTVYELIVSQIRATNGSIWVSDAIKLDTVTKVGSNYKCTIDTDEGTIYIPFQVNDIIRCQKFNGKNMKYYTARVVSTNYADGFFTIEIIEGASFPSAKDDVVRIGNSTDTNRQGAIYITSSDNGSPFIDVIDGVTSASLAGKTKVRLGKLDGIVDPSLGQLSGYGLYANSAYIKGKFIVENGSNVYTKTENDGKISTAKNEAVASAKTYTDSQSTKAYNDAKTYADTEIAELRQSVNDLETEIEGAFADGIIQEAEAISIEKYLNVLAREKADIDNQFTIVYPNTLLTGATKTNLNTAKTNLNTSYTFLVSAINSAIQDGKTTPTEKTAVDNAFADYKNKFGVYSTRVNEALEAIRNKGINDLNTSMKAYSDAQDSAKETIIKAYADGKVDAEEARAIADAEAKLNQAKADATQKANDAITTSTNNAKAYTDAQINELGGVLEDLESTINTTFQDGIIEKAEAIAIEKYINEINVEKLQLDNQYSIVYANTNLVGTAKTNLASAKTAYNSNHTTLINSINNAIADGKTTEAEKNAVNTHFGNYRTALGTLSTRIQEAIESIRAKASTDLDTTLKAYALAQDNLKETIIKAYADGIVTEEEQRAIADAEAKLAQAKADATAKANQAKQDAINASAIDAQNKANQAQANAIASANQFSLDAIKAINIGGRNLLRDSRHKNFKLYGSASYGNIQLSDDYPTQLIRINKVITAITPVGFQNNSSDVFQIIQGQEYIISFDVRSENIPSLNYIYLMRNDGTNFSYGSIIIPSGEEFSRVTKTITAPFSSNQTYLMFSYNGANTGWVEVKSIKIEKGNKATDWSPNPDEVEDNLEIFRTQTTTKFEVLETAIQSKVSQSDYNALNQRVGTAESTITQHANQIQSKVSQTSFDTLNNTVGGLSGRVSSAESSITQQAGLIATKVSQSEVDVTVGNAVNNIQIGGKNYQKNITVDFTHNGVETFDIINDREIKLKFKTSNPAGTPYVFLQTIEPYTQGLDYTLSFYIKGKLDSGSGNVRISFGMRGTGSPDISQSFAQDQWIKINRQLTFSNQHSSSCKLIIFSQDWAQGVTFEIKDVKLEQGTKATDWTPAPSDIDNNINDLKSRVTNAETSITQNSDKIELRATKQEVTTAQNSAVTTSKSYTDNQISVTNSAISLKADKTITDSLNSRMNNAELKITPEAIKTTVRAETQQITNNAISNIKLGGTNILRDSLLKTPTMWGSTYGNLVITQNEPSNMVRYNKTVTTDGAFGYQRSSVADRFSVKQNENYILSFDIRGNINNINYVFLMRNESGQNNQRIVDLNGIPIPNISTTTFTRLEIPFIPTYSNDLSSIIIAHQAPTTFWFEITNVQVEKGNKGTDYSPNPIDVNNEIVALNTRINSAETSITQTISAIALKADKTVTDGLTTRMSNAEAKITPSAINLTVKDQTENIAQASIDKISIGGINILRNSRMLPVGQNSGATTEKLTESDGTSYYRTTLTSSGGYGYQWSNNFNGSAIRDYPMTITFGLDMRTPNANGKTFRLYMRTQVSAGAYDQVGKPVALTPEWQRHYVTLDITKAYTNLLFLYGTDGTNSGYTATTGDIVEVKNFKVERGNKGTDYSVAPEDIDSDIKDIVRIQDTRDTNENPAWYFTNYKMMNVREFKRRDVIGLGNVTSSSVYCELTTYVPWTDFSGGPVVQEATVERITYSRFGTTTAWSSWLEGESTAGSQAKANTAQTQAIAGAKTYTDNQINITNTAITLKADKTVTDGLTTRMSNAEAKITADAINLTVKAQTQQIANQATAQTFANGKMLYTDPAFVVGENGMVQYPSSVGTVMSRVNNQTDSPTKNNIAYKFLHTAMADSNRCSLVRWANQSRANAIFVTRIIAKLPVGWRIQDAHNTYGDSANRSVTWLTPTLGTGMYEEYVLKLVCGNTGTFSTINHFDLRKVDANTPTPTTANPIESYIAWATVYDMSEVYNKPDEEEIKAGISITSNSVNVFGKSLSLAGKVTFTSLDSGTQSTINTANNNASSALSTAGTANSNANTALSTANTANSNATNAKSKTDAWTYTGKTTINGGQIEANSITADKINTDNLTARQIKTSDLTSRLSINETNDNTIKIRHTNGQVAISMGLVGGVPKIVFYDSSGNKVWEGGTAGIVYVNDVPESWTTGNLFFMDSISSATETLTTTKINTFKNKIKLNSSGSVTNRQMNSGTIYYLYSEGINATSGTNKQYAGYHTNQVKSVSNFIPNGWYVFGNSTLFSDGPGSGTYSATVFKVFNGLVQDDYDVISGIS